MPTDDRTNRRSRYTGTREERRKAELEDLRLKVQAVEPLALSGPPEDVIPVDIVKDIFGGILCCTPGLWNAYVQVLVDRFGTGFDATKAYTKKVWSQGLREARAANPDGEW